jgi:uncharacterized protein YndB with AHSA1/START domain
VPTTGRYENSDGQPTVRFERTFPQPVLAVWDALTDPGQLEMWFPTTVEFEKLSEGAPITFRFPKDAYPEMTGSWLEVDRPNRLSFSWGDDVLTFELAAGEDGDETCRLSFSVALDSADKAARDGAGWEQCLDALEIVTAGECPHRPMPTEAWNAYYEEYKRQGVPAEAEIPQPQTAS